MMIILINDNHPGNESSTLSAISWTSPVPIHAAAKAGEQYEDDDDDDGGDEDDDGDEYEYVLG